VQRYFDGFKIKDTDLKDEHGFICFLCFESFCVVEICVPKRMKYLRCAGLQEPDQASYQWSITGRKMLCTNRQRSTFTNHHSCTDWLAGENGPGGVVLVQEDDRESDIISGMHGLQSMHYGFGLAVVLIPGLGGGQGANARRLDDGNCVSAHSTAS
jgi:hypothetical protein